MNKKSRQRFKYIGRSEAHGDIYVKGKVQIIVYGPKWDRLFRYWPYGCPGKTWERRKEGMDFHHNSNW